MRILKRAILLSILALAMLALSGCQYMYMGWSLVSVAPVVPPRGYVYAHFRAPLVIPTEGEMRQTLDFKGDRVVYVKIPTPYVNTEITMGRVDLEAACRRAGIKHLVAADYEYRSIAGYFKTVNIHAYGYPYPPGEGSDKHDPYKKERPKDEAALKPEEDAASEM